MRFNAVLIIGFLLLALFLLRVVVRIYSQPTGSVRSNQAYRLPLKIGRKALSVELALTKDEQARGLSVRDHLDDDSGMLFVFSFPHRATFWMKEMRFPLDMVWLRDKRVIDIHENVPVPTAETLPTYSPREDITMVLEVPAGSTTRWGIEVGDKVTIDDSLIIKEQQRRNIL